MTPQAATIAVPGVQLAVHWRGEPAEEFSGPLFEVAARLPSFDRAPFGANPRLDVILRRPVTPDAHELPAGVVSKKYRLVQHGSIVDALVTALRTVDVKPSDVRCRLTMAESGARIAIRVELPERFTVKPPDGHRMALTFECFNSVDRSVPLFAVLGWFRFVCGNGLVIGTAHARVRHQHRPSLRVEEIEPTLVAGLEAAERDSAELNKQAATRVTDGALRAWVDRAVSDAWGPFAAARVHAIVTRGVDGEPRRTPRHARPHEREILRPVRVPGANAPCLDLYGIAQALAWVASRRHDVAERVSWGRAITQLIAQLQ